MTYLLDTHTFLWALIDPDKLSEKVKSIIEIPENRIMVSVISKDGQIKQYESEGIIVIW